MTMSILDILVIAVVSMLAMVAALLVITYRGERWKKAQESEREVHTEDTFGAVVDGNGIILAIQSKDKAWREYVGHNKQELDAAIRLYVETGVVPAPKIKPNEWNA